MQKVKQNYIAELIIISAIAIALLTSCKTTEETIKCCDKETSHALWNCGESIEYKYSELLDCENCDELD